MFKTGYINNNDLLYSPLNGLSIYNKVMYTEFADDCADIFFKLLHKPDNVNVNANGQQGGQGLNTGTVELPSAQLAACIQ